MAKKIDRPKKNKRVSKKKLKKLNSKDPSEKKEFFINNVAKFCDKCGTEYTKSDVHIVQESNFSSIIHFSCDNCKSNHIATFIKPMGMSSRVPVNTDLSIGEISKYAKRESVSTDEVLALFDRLEKDNTIKKF
jgi:hypothetical protein